MTKYFDERIKGTRKSVRKWHMPEDKDSKRGLASASEETRERVARAGGEAHHEERGLQAANEETRERVASAGGSAPHEERGLQAANEETRERVAKAGGVARGKDKESLSEAGRKGGQH